MILQGQGLEGDGATSTGYLKKKQNSKYSNNYKQIFEIKSPSIDN